MFRSHLVLERITFWLLKKRVGYECEEPLIIVVRGEIIDTQSRILTMECRDGEHILRKVKSNGSTRQTGMRRVKNNPGCWPYHLGWF